MIKVSHGFSHCSEEELPSRSPPLISPHSFLCHRPYLSVFVSILYNLAPDYSVVL